MLTYLVDLHPDDCAGLLASTTLGRLGVVVDGRPEIFPVNYVYERASGTISFPSQQGTKLDAALAWPWVSFEIDGMDPDGTSGWSVLVVGSAEVISDPDEVARIARRREAPWAAGSATTWVRITPKKVTGRRICASDHGIALTFS